MLSKGFLRDHANFLVWCLILGDITGLLVCGHWAFSIYVPDVNLYERYQSVFIFSVLLWLLVSPYMGLYAARRGVAWHKEARDALFALSTVLLTLLLISATTKTTSEFSRVWIVLWFCSAALWLLSERILLRGILAYLRKRGFNQRYLLIISSNGLGRQVIDSVSKHPHAGLIVNGYFSDDESELSSASNVHKVYPLDDLLAFMKEKTVDQVWLAIPLHQQDKITQIMHLLRHETADIRLLPDVETMHIFQKPMSQLVGLNVIDISVGPMDGTNKIIKSAEDFVISALIIFMISPLLLFIAVGVKLSSPGPVLYRQDRVSWNGKRFGMYKFRSMPVDTEQQSGAVWAKSGEQRATSFGAFLRKTSLDELPQFFNVLKGDMSIVGPRPERPVFVEQFKEEIPGYMQKHKVKAGITGWAQVNGWRGDTCLETRIEHDLYYINSWSLWFDLKIIFLTLFKGFVHKNAY